MTTATAAKPQSKDSKPSPSEGLTFVEPGTDPHVNTLLYGPPKTGKTTGASSAPGPVLYVNADRPNATRFAHKQHPDMREVRMEGLRTLVALTSAIDSGDYSSVVLDPIGEFYGRLLEDLSGRSLRPTLPTYGDTGTHLERFCRYLCEAPVHAVFTAHEHSVKDEAAGVVEKLPWTGTNNPAFAEKLMAMVDVIGYTGVLHEEGEEDRYLATLVNAEGRRGGNRFGLGNVRDVDLAEWIAAAAEYEKKGSA